MAAVLLSSAGLLAQTSPKGELLVLSKGSNMLVAVDVASGKAMARMPSGPDPHEVIASADGKLAYISNYGGGAYNTLAVVDLVAHQTLTAIDLGALRGPHGLVFEGGKVWFTAEAAKSIGRFDPVSKRVDWLMGTGQDRTHMLFVTPDLKKIYTTNVSSASVTLLQQGGPPRMDWEETVVPVGKGVEGFDVSPDGKELWAANAGDGTVSVIDLAAQKVTATLAAGVNSANRLKFTPDGHHVLVSTLNGPDLVVLDAGTHQVVKRIPLGHGAAGILIEPGGERAFVACTPDDYVAVVDLKSLEVSRHLNAGPHPDGLAWAVQP